MKKVLVYVISCWQEPYRSMMMTSRQTWDSKPIDGIKTLFYCGKPQHPEVPGIVQFGVDEGLYNMGHKNLVAYWWALEHEDWQFMVRVNASTYVRKRQMLEYCQTLPDTNLIQGAGVRDGGQEVKWLWGGLNFIFSRDVVKKIVNNGHLWNHKVMEDNATSQITKGLGIPWNLDIHASSLNRSPKGWLLLNYGSGEPGGEFSRLEDISNSRFRPLIRVKQDLHRHQDSELMRQLHAMGV